jgi:hypothetical protein
VAVISKNHFTLPHAATQTNPIPEDFFGPPPLIGGEDPVAYDALTRKVTADVQPRDTIEKLLIRDFVDLAWEVFRLRRLKANVLKTGEDIGIDTFIRRLLPNDDSAYDLSEEWTACKPRALRRVSNLLTKAGVTADAVVGETLVARLDDVERIDRLIASAEARRNNALREIDRHRSALGAALRAAIEEAEDAEFTDVEASQSVAETAQ